MLVVTVPFTVALDGYTCGHSFTNNIVTKVPTCTEVGIETAVCDLGCGETDFRTIPMLGHTEEIVKGYGVTCENSGLTDGVKCSVCGEMLTAHQEIGVLDHRDDDGDYLCDYGCGYEFEKPAEPDTPDEPSDTECITFAIRTVSSALSGR